MNSSESIGEELLLTNRSNSTSKYAMMTCTPSKASRFITHASFNSSHFVSIRILIGPLEQFNLDFDVPTLQFVQAPLIFFDDLSSPRSICSFSRTLNVTCANTRASRTRRKACATTMSSGIVIRRWRSPLIIPLASLNAFPTNKWSDPPTLSWYSSHPGDTRSKFCLVGHTEFHRHATCTHTNGRSERQVRICAEKTSRNYSTKFIYRTDAILCGWIRRNNGWSMSIFSLSVPSDLNSRGRCENASFPTDQRKQNYLRWICNFPKRFAGWSMVTVGVSSASTILHRRLGNNIWIRVMGRSTLLSLLQRTTIVSSWKKRRMPTVSLSFITSKSSPIRSTFDIWSAKRIARHIILTTPIIFSL